MIDPSLFLLNLTLFVLAIFLGVELINKVPATLHTPLMSGANAVSGISVIGALFGTQIVMQDDGRSVASLLAGLALMLAMGCCVCLRLGPRGQRTRAFTQTEQRARTVTTQSQAT